MHPMLHAHADDIAGKGCSAGGDGDLGQIKERHFLYHFTVLFDHQTFACFTEKGTIIVDNQVYAHGEPPEKGVAVMIFQKGKLSLYFIIEPGKNIHNKVGKYI